MALSPLFMALFSWSHVNYSIRELTVTPLEERCTEEEEGRGSYITQRLSQSVATHNNISRDKH